MAYRMVLKHHFEDKKLKEFLKNLPDATMRVGWGKGQTEENGMLTADVAYLNEVGHNIIRDGKVIGHVVPRPFMALTAETNKNSWQQAWRRWFREFITGKKGLRATMNQFCRLVIDDIRHMIEVEKPFAPNKPSTIARKKQLSHPLTPLVDFGTLVDKLTYEVEIKGSYKGK